MRKLIHEAAFAVFAFALLFGLVALVTGYRQTASGCAALCVAAYAAGWFTTGPRETT